MLELPLGRWTHDKYKKRKGQDSSFCWEKIVDTYVPIFEKVANIKTS